MSEPLTPFDDDFTTATALLDSENVDNAAIELAARWNGPCCEKCQAPMKSDMVAVCRRCGWYGSLGQFVDVDQSWETYDDDAEQPAPAAAPSHLEIWAKLLPTWAWIIVGTVAAVVVESVAIRLLTDEDSELRTVWSLTQLTIGIMLFFGCHVLNFVMVASDEPDCGALDMIVRPLGVWMRTFRKLPKRLVVTDGAAAGYTAIMMSLLVIGGLPYERLWDWGFKQPPKQNLLGAVAEQVQKVEGEGADNLEDAINDFAKKQDLEDKKGKTPPKPLAPRPEVDCVILGYRLDTDGRLSGLILGTAYKGKLVFACAVAPSPDSKESQDLMNLLPQVRVDEPYVPMQGAALWVRPIYACRVNCDKQAPNGRLQNASWKEFLGKLK